MEVTYHVLSDKGSRQKNEDRVGTYEKDGSYCFVVADGLGGHGKGDVSRIVVDTCVEQFKEQGYSGYYMIDAFEISQENLLKEQQRIMMPEDVKTTLVLLCISEDKIEWGYIGDSRLYLFENRKKVLHTLDHSVPQMLVNIGEITDSEIRRHPDRSHLLRAMGFEWKRPKYEISQVYEPKKGMAFLMATDGFWELVEDEEMEQCLKKAKDVHEWMKQMEQIVIRNGNGQEMDNYSAIGVWIN